MLKNIKYLFVGAILVSLMLGCQSSPKPAAKESGAVKQEQVGKAVSGMKNVYISSKAKFTGEQIAQNIKDECSIDSQIMKFIKVYGAKNNMNIVVDGKAKSDDLVLKISIVDAISQRGMGYGGHNKYIVISGKLYKGKKLQSSFTAARRSGGGYFGMYRSSCSVLGSCAKTLGRDTATWLVNPKNNAKLGDVYLIR